MNTIHEFVISYHSAAGDFNDHFSVWNAEPVMEADAVMLHMQERDAENAGMPVEETCGFTYLASFAANELIARTNGMGPTPKDNITLLVGWRKTGRAQKFS